MAGSEVEIKFSFSIGEVPEAHKAEAGRKAQEAFVLALLRQGDISAGRAGELLDVDRWQLAQLMSDHGISPFDESLTREDLEREAAGCSGRPGD